MFNFDIFNRPDPFEIYLCRPDGSVLCELNAIEEDTAEMTYTLNNQFELMFDYDRFISTLDGEEIESNGYHQLAIDMKLLIDDVGYFVIQYPPYQYNGEKEKKTVTAYSVECELENKDLVGFKINTGESDSLEYLITYDDDEEETLLNAYTGLPYDYILFDNTYPEQLSELLGKYEDGATITDEDAIAEIKSYCDMISRLKSKVVTYEGEDDDGLEASLTKLIEYVEYTYDDDYENVISIYLFPEEINEQYPELTNVGFNQRIADLIEYYTKYHDQLSLVSLAIENCSCNWSVGEIDSSLAGKKYQFDVDGENIYSFLTNEVAQTVNCVFSFDLFNKKINAILVENIGEDSGVIIDRNNLINTVDVSCEEDHIYTRFSVSGADGLGIEYVNFGLSRIDDLRYFLEARDENGKRIYVSDELAEKYYQFAYDRELARQVYMDYTKTYNQLLADIDEIKYRVPNDIVQTDWDTFTLTELEEALKNYKNLLVTLVSLYKEDYGAEGVLDDDRVDENYIRGTMYWYDYYAYTVAIAQIQAAYEAKVNNSSYADIGSEEILKEINAWETEWSLYGTVELQNKIEAYVNQLSVMADGGAVIFKYPPIIDYNATCVSQSDEDFKEIWIEGEGALPSSLDGKVVSVLFTSRHQRPYGVYFSFYYRNDEDGSVTEYYIQPESYMEDQMYTWSTGDTVYFRFTSDNHVEMLEQTWEAYTWDELTENQKMQYMNLDVNYYYDTYYEVYSNWKSCTEYLETLLPELEAKQAELDEVQASRSKFYTLVTVEGYNREELGKIVDLPDSDVSGTFTENEIKTINLLYIDTTYENENILTTSLDTTVTAVSVEYDLLLDAREELSISSQPQITFSTDIDNLLALPEFKNFKFDIGNYTTLKYYDDYYVTLRLYSMTFNPCAPESSLQVSFTNYIRSQSERSDLSYILSQASGVGGGGYGSGGSGSGGAFGTSSDIDVTISNTMLAQLLNSETFGTRVSNIILDTIDVNSLYAQVATFGGLGAGTTTINGNCVRTGYILSNNLSGGDYTITTIDGIEIITEHKLNNTEGTIIDLNTGEFNFGGGKLTLIDGNLTVEGTITAAAGSKIGPWVISEESIYRVDERWGEPGTEAEPASYLGNAGISVTDKFTVDQDGNVNIQSGSITISDGAFSVDSNGNLTASSATINGKITASSGSQIGGWYCTNGKICAGLGDDHCYPDGTKNEDTNVFNVAVMQIPGGTNGEATNVFAAGSEGNHSNYGKCQFRVTKAGKLYATDADITGDINANSITALYSYNINNAAGKEVTAISSPEGAFGNYIMVGTTSIIELYLQASNFVITGAPLLVGEDGGSSLSCGSLSCGSITSSGSITASGNITISRNASSNQTARLNLTSLYTMYVSSTYGGNLGLYNQSDSSWIIQSVKNGSDWVTCLGQVRDHTTTSSANIHIAGNGDDTIKGELLRYSSSSLRYKVLCEDVIKSDIEELYDIPVHWFKYNEDYLSKGDERDGKEIPGFVAEEWDDIMPIAVDHNEDGSAEMWNSNIVIPLMFEMIKNDHNQIEELKNKISELQASA